jgi:hypothetical protein
MQFGEDFEIVGPIRNVVTIARGHGIRDLAWVRQMYGPGQWRKCKGHATVLYVQTGEAVTEEVHWYEAHGVGKRGMKIKHGGLR